MHKRHITNYKKQNFILFKFYENNLNADINEIIQKGFILNSENSLKYPILGTDNIFNFLLNIISKL